MSKKKKINKEDIIIEAFLECLEYDHRKYRQEVKDSGKIVHNPYFWEQGEFISINYIDKYGNICYTVTQPGTKPTDSYHEIGVALPYDNYKPFHDKWVRFGNRMENLNKLIQLK